MIDQVNSYMCIYVLSKSRETLFIDLHRSFLKQNIYKFRYQTCVVIYLFKNTYILLSTKEILYVKTDNSKNRREKKNNIKQNVFKRSKNYKKKEKTTKSLNYKKARKISKLK